MAKYRSKDGGRVVDAEQFHSSLCLDSELCPIGVEWGRDYAEHVCVAVADGSRQDIADGDFIVQELGGFRAVKEAEFLARYELIPSPTVKARARPAEVECVQWCDPADNSAVLAFGGHCDRVTESHSRIYVRTRSGVLQVGPGDHVVKHQNGDFSVCKQDAFAATYEKEAEHCPGEPKTGSYWADPA